MSETPKPWYLTDEQRERLERLLAKKKYEDNLKELGKTLKKNPKYSDPFHYLYHGEVYEIYPPITGQPFKSIPKFLAAQRAKGSK
jgi:hypothetical protein